MPDAAIRRPHLPSFNHLPSTNLTQTLYFPALCSPPLLPPLRLFLSRPCVPTRREVQDQRVRLSVCAGVVLSLSVSRSRSDETRHQTTQSIYPPVHQSPPSTATHISPHQNHLNASDRPAPEILARITTRHRASEPQETQHPLQQPPPAPDRVEITTYGAKVHGRASVLRAVPHLPAPPSPTRKYHAPGRPRTTQQPPSSTRLSRPGHMSDRIPPLNSPSLSLSLSLLLFSDRAS